MERAAQALTEADYQWACSLNPKNPNLFNFRNKPAETKQLGPKLIDCSTVNDKVRVWTSDDDLERLKRIEAAKKGITIVGKM